jgi:hypothetical protein
VTRPSDGVLLGHAGAPGHGRLLARTDLDRVVIAVADVNGDGAMWVVVALHRDDDGVWRECAWSGAGVLGSSWAGGAAFAYGRHAGCVAVQVSFRGRRHEVVVGPDGWWVFATPADEGEWLDLSAVPVPPGID